MVEKETLVLLPLTAQEIVQRLGLPLSLNAGEAESIALCKARGAADVTNDRRARNFCRTLDVEVFDLPEVLRACWKLRVCTKQKVRQLVASIETQEGLIIKHKVEIFAR